MRAFEFVNEAKYDYSLADYQDTPFDKGFEHMGPALAKYSEPNIGPQEGKYLNLMLRGMKPATVIDSDAERELFSPYIKDGTIIVADKTPYSLFLTLPGEEWRGPKLKKLFNILQNRYDMDDNELRQLEAKIGMLLGIPKESIRYYLKTRI